MKFLPFLRPATLVGVAAALSACNSVTNTPANRRELYNTSYNQSGAWHDYTRRREAEAETGTSGGTAPSALPGRGKPAAMPPGSGAPGPLPPGTGEPAMQAPMSPAAPAAAPNVPPPADVAPIPGAGADTTTGAAAPGPTSEPVAPPPQ